MKLARINTGLLLAIVLINAYVIVMPFLPALFFKAEKHSTVKQLQQKVSSKPGPITANAETLIVPSMALDAPVNEGKTIATLRQGLWRLPYTSTPDKGGNTVIVAHRFTYTNPRGMFYHLDQVHVGDQIAVLWHGKKYVYKTTTTEVVPPTEVSVEAPTADSILTLYTCTPLWNPKDRLVVTASLESVQ
ncbi:MAG TPA: class E sortase [Candidatus Saccharimonadales bacterium]|nr:class E sortase [Candidatus Saccharimonadales bacterium]